VNPSVETRTASFLPGEWLFAHVQPLGNTLHNSKSRDNICHFCDPLLTQAEVDEKE
jgi:hypothetical protein